MINGQITSALHTRCKNDQITPELILFSQKNFQKWDCETVHWNNDTTEPTDLFNQSQIYNECKINLHNIHYSITLKVDITACPL